MKQDIDEWVSPEYSTYPFGEGNLMSCQLFSKNGATVVVDCGVRVIDTFQQVKINGSWKIVNKIFVDR